MGGTTQRRWLRGIGIALFGCLLVPALGYGLLYLWGEAAALAMISDWVLLPAAAAWVIALLFLSRAQGTRRVAAAGLVVSATVLRVVAWCVGVPAFALFLGASVRSLQGEPAPWRLCLRMTGDLLAVLLLWLTASTVSERAVGQVRAADPFSDCS